MLLTKRLSAADNFRFLLNRHFLIVVFLLGSTAALIFFARSFWREDLQAQALAEGRRIEISLITGEVEADQAVFAPVVERPVAEQSAVSESKETSAIDNPAPHNADENLPVNEPFSSGENKKSSPENILDDSNNNDDAEGDVKAEISSPEEAMVKTDAHEKEESTEAAEEEAPDPVSALNAAAPKEYVGRDLYARVSSFDKPLVAILLTGLGLSTASTEQALQLPKNITLGFSPYSTSLEDWLERAEHGGYEVALHVPMQTANMRQSDPGPFSLLINAGEEQNIQRMKTLLGLAPNTKSVYSDYDETLSLTMSSISPLLRVLREKNTLFVYGAGHANQVLLQRSLETGQALVVNDMILDNQIDSEAIAKQLLDLEEIALRKGYAVAMARPYPITCQLLARWEATLPKKRIHLVKISELGNALQKVLQGDTDSAPKQ